MSENNYPATLGDTNTKTRRQMIAGAAIALGGLAAGSEVWGMTLQDAMKQTPSTAANQKRTSLHHETDFKASPQRIYEALLDSKQFTAFSGMPAEIDSKAGGAFSLFGGMIVQAWRPTHWDPGVYSIARFELKAQGSDTLLIFDHTGFPEGEFDHLDWGWHNHYWEPLKKFLV